MRSRQNVWSTPTSQEKLVSGFRSGLEKPGKKSSFSVGARKPAPALPRMRVPVSLMTHAAEPRGVVWVPKALLSSMRPPPVRKMRSKNRNCCSKKNDLVWVALLNTPLLSPSSWRYSSPTVLLLQGPTKHELIHYDSRRSTFIWDACGSLKS